MALWIEKWTEESVQILILDKLDLILLQKHSIPFNSGEQGS